MRSCERLPVGDLADFIAAGHAAVFAKSGAGKSFLIKMLWQEQPFIGVFITPHDDLPPGTRIQPTGFLPALQARKSRMVWKAPQEHEVEGGRDEAIRQLSVLVSGIIDHGKKLIPKGADAAPVWCVVAIDECHNFTNKTGYIGPVERLLSEGRKYGVKVILASQRPARVSLEVIGQTEHKFFLKLEPPDAKYLQQAGYPVDEWEAHTAKPRHFVVLRDKTWVPYRPI